MVLLTIVLAKCMLTTIVVGKARLKIYIALIHAWPVLTALPHHSPHRTAIIVKPFLWILFICRNSMIYITLPSVSPAELLLSREMRRTLAQHRTNKSPLLVSYLYSIGDPRHPSPLCPLCLMHDHTSSHLFECKSLPTSLSSLDLWTNPDKVEPFLATWGGETVGCHMIRVLDSAGSTLVEWGRQQHCSVIEYEWISIDFFIEVTSPTNSVPIS